MFRKFILPWLNIEVENTDTPEMVVQNGSPFVQRTTLTKLICTRCKRFLSYLPIYRHIAEGPICGRCPIGNTENFIHDKLYENAVEYQKFPCIYYESGCLENLFPHQVAEHENRCTYKLLECPTRIYNNCTWQGSIANIMEHFESKHPTFTLKDCRFEVDFVNNHSENYVMPFAEDIYLVTREANPVEKTFAIIVSYLGSNSAMDKYIYCLTLESGNRAYKYSLSQDVGKKLELQGEIVRKMLHDPMTIIASISVQEAPINKTLPSEDSVLDDDNDNPNVDHNQLRELECPICMEYMVPPIYQCLTGHSMCKTCKEKQKECPTCRVEIKITQNFALENIIRNMIYPCKHKGCKYATKAKDIRQHEATCLLGPFQCPLEDYESCNAFFPISELFNHIKAHHYESLLELDTLSIPVSTDIAEDISEGYILRHSQMLFKICFKYNQGENTFYWAVQLVGPVEESAKYKYELEIIDNNGKDNRLYIKTNCSPLTVKDKSFENENHYVYLDYEQVAKFIKNQLTYRITIITEK